MDGNRGNSVGTEVIFTVNGQKYTVSEDVPIGTSLNSFLRDYCSLKGTKYMCYEGGCGSCIVTVNSQNAFTKKRNTYAVNSCLVPVHACQGWSVTTVEGLGNKKSGYHKAQSRLAHLNGTQCGYCSPGMVMNMYSLMQGKNDIKMKEVENAFGGNICRCTGYRPILDAFKSLCSDAPPEVLNKVLDIEDLYKVKKCKETGEKCSGDCTHIHGTGEECLEEEFIHISVDGEEIIQHGRLSPLHLNLKGGTQWIKATKLKDIFDIFDKIGDATYMLIAGNTAQGVYRMKEPPKVYIDVKDVPELVSYSMTSTLKLGGNMTLTDTMQLFFDLSAKAHNFMYLEILASHIDLIANVPVRNIGTLAGNLMLKHDHNEFPSDLFLILETVHALVNIASKGKTKKICLCEFLDTDMKHKVIESIELPPYDQNVCIKTYKIMPRAQNAHAYVNAGFRFTLEKNNKGKVTKRPTIVFGGINPMMVHATKSEDYLDMKNLYDVKVLQTAIQTLQAELQPDHVLPDASPEYRNKLACGLFYKFVLNLSPPGLPERYISGGADINRPLSSGRQSFPTDKDDWPLTKPVPKLEAIAQCSGEAQYINDMPSFPHETFAAFVLATVPQGYITNIDPSEALKMRGVLKFLKASDIPGKNTFTPINNIDFIEEEQVFCSGEVKYTGQPIGLIVAESQGIALSAVFKVKVEYNNTKKPLLTIQQVIDSGDKSRIIVKVPADISYLNTGQATHVIKGSFQTGAQYHFTMETQQCICVPVEDGMDIFPSTQNINLAQYGASQALNLPENSFNIKVRRVGGAYGAKISRNSLASTACAVAAHILNRPVRLLMSLEDCMEAMGKRNDILANYEVGTDDNGKIQYLKMDYYENEGSAWNEFSVPDSINFMKSCYDSSTWKVKGMMVRTDIPSATWCRAPGSTEAVATIEHIMQHVAKVLRKDALGVRMLNINKQLAAVTDMIKSLRSSSEYDARKQSIDDFNVKNRWVKKGISLVPMTFNMAYLYNYTAQVSIYGHDGTVAVAHGGIECGQGINTKVAQTVAYSLGIGLDQVSVKPTNNLTSPNDGTTGGSMSSELCCYAAMQCCKELLKRMEPIKKTIKDPTWIKVVKQSVAQSVDLVATHMFPYNDDVKGYNIFGVCVTEIELDILTGRHQILRVDILEDAGKSLSPQVDIGQVEGAFVMGLGYWLQEHIVYDPNTGKNLTNRTWNYKPPGAKDIPIDFRVELRKNAPNPFGVLRSKATGEPPLCLAVSVLFALRYAIESHHKDAGLPDTWFNIKLPASPENTLLACELNIKHFIV